MTLHNQGQSRLFAAAMSLLLMAAFWLPTVETPGVAASAPRTGVLVMAASGAYAPALM